VEVDGGDESIDAMAPDSILILFLVTQASGVPPSSDEPGQWGVFHESRDAEAQDERNDGQILKDVLFSISEWKDRQQRKLLHQLFHSRRRRDEEVTCYGDLGCFRDEGPFNYLDMLPSPPEEIGTVFLLYTQQNRELHQVLEYNNVTTVSNSFFNASSPTKVIIHGFGSSCDKVWAREMRLSFLAVEDCNVICVDWAAGAVDPNYVRAAVNTRLVGKQVALLIKAINLEFGDINNNTHLVGFSLGAHVSGFVGKELRNLSRITGLDPAGPLFEGYSPKVRLDKTDADYVDVIHSNGDSLIIGGLGAWEPIGHVDFYPNGGKAQRGCQNLLIGGLYDFIYSYSTKNESYRYLCNHRRAYKLFTDSISPKCKFTAFPCDSYEKFESGQCFTCNSEVGECGELGYYSNLSPGRGSLYLLTRETEPFCANQFKINLMFTGSRLPLYTYGALQIKLINHDGINETFTLTSTHDELLTSGAKIEKLIVAHPALDRPVEVQILYIAYEGWIYSGRYQWSVDKLTITDGFGKQLSFCKDQGELLPSGIPIPRKLQLGDCVPSSHKHDFPPHVDKIAKKPPLSANLRPPLPGDINKVSHQGLDVEQPNNFVTDLPPIKHDLVVHNNNRQPLPDFDPELDMTTVPKPLVLPIEQQMNMPGKSNQQHHYEYNINNSIKKASQGHVWTKKHGGPSVGGAPLQPYHLSGPPGAWNIITSKPGSLPPPIHVYQSKFPTSKPGIHSSAGIELQYGPKFPPALLPPLAQIPPGHFPTRRRPSTGGSGGRPRHPVDHAYSGQDLAYAGSDTTSSVVTVPSTTEGLIHPATERTDLLREEDIIIVDNSVDKDPEPNRTQQPITNDDILSDDQLAIFKVGPDNNVEQVVNMSSFDQNVTNTELTDYKYVILHKLPNGEALNLENLKTYNYAELVNDYKNQFSNEDLEEFDRENLGYYDVPRRFSDNKNPYIIYQLNDPALKNGKPSSELREKLRLPSKGVRPVYRPTTEKTSRPPSSYVFHTTRKSPVFVPQPPTEPPKVEKQPLSHDDVKLLQSKVEEILSSSTEKTHQPAYPQVTKHGSRPPAPAANDWVPTDTGPKGHPHPGHLPHLKVPKLPKLDLHRLTKLSQLASVSIADAGSLADTVKSIREKSAAAAGRLTIQLLPPRLSAVLTHLDGGGGGAQERQQAARALPGSSRQNKIAPAFKAARRERHGGLRSKHGRSGEDYIVTQPYQTQVIPKERRSRFIPLGPPAPKPVPWWHPAQPSLQRSREQASGHHYGPGPNPITMSNNLRAPNAPNYHPSRPVYLPERQDSHLISSGEWGAPIYKSQTEHPLWVGPVFKEAGQEKEESSRSDLHAVPASAIDSLGLKHRSGIIVRNLERINDLEKKASHLQKPFLPGPVVPGNLLVKKDKAASENRRIDSSKESEEADRRNSLQSSGKIKEDRGSSSVQEILTFASSASEEYPSNEKELKAVVAKMQDRSELRRSSSASSSQFKQHKRISEPIMHFYEASSSSAIPTSTPTITSSSSTTSPPSPPVQAENVQVPISSQLRSESSLQEASTKPPKAETDR